MANLYLNLGINVSDLFKEADKAQLKQIQDVAADGFTTAELKTLEEDGIDVSLIKDNAVEKTPIEVKETDSAELKEAKAKLIEINKKILDNTTEQRELEADIIFLEDEVNTEFEELVDKQQTLEEKQKEDIKEAQAKVQEKFASSEGEMTKDEYEESLGDEIDKLDTKYGTKFSSIAVDFAKNNKKATELATKIETQNCLIADTNDLKAEADELTKLIEAKQQEHDAALVADGGTYDKRKTDDGLGEVNGLAYSFFKHYQNSEQYEALYNEAIAMGLTPEAAAATVVKAGNTSGGIDSFKNLNITDTVVAVNQDAFNAAIEQNGSVEVSNSNGTTSTYDSTTMSMIEMQQTGKWA